MQCDVPFCNNDGEEQEGIYPLSKCKKHSGKKKNYDFFGRRWLEFRIGYSTYLVFMFGFSNFMLILYNFFPNLKDTIEIQYFFPLVLIIIIPISIIIGHTHNKKQFPIEAKLQTHLNPYVYKIIPTSKETMATKLAITNLEILEHLAKKTGADLTLVQNLEKLRNDYTKLLNGIDSREIL